jgi:anti-sigma regulatory factor (Ser/Thr protein kinase)
MTGRAVLESVTVAGRAERARVARVFVSGVLGPGNPCGYDVALLVSELFGNSLRHSGSGAPGRMVMVSAASLNG